MAWGEGINSLTTTGYANNRAKGHLSVAECKAKPNKTPNRGWTTTTKLEKSFENRTKLNRLEKEPSNQSACTESSAHRFELWIQPFNRGTMGNQRNWLKTTIAPPICVNDSKQIARVSVRVDAPFCEHISNSCHVLWSVWPQFKKYETL